MRKLLLILILILIGSIVGFSVSIYTFKQAKVHNFDQTTQTDVIYYDSFFKTLDEVSVKSSSMDLTGDNKPELAYTTISKDCVSCHAQKIYIFRDRKIIFSGEYTSPEFKVLSNISFSIKEAVGNTADSCCPADFETNIYKWNGNHFNKI